VHSGQAFGIGGRIAFFLAGIALTVLVASGFLQWNARRRGQKRRPAAQTAV
jgi:uncharacterized iron-regulated membrane protein